MDSLTFLERAAREKLHSVYVLHGEESFLKRRVLEAFRVRVFGPDGDDLGLSTYSGEKASFAAVHDELHTLPFLAARRLVIVENADAFVTAHRPALEQYVAEPAPHGILVLDVKSWPATTRLARAIPPHATLTCKSPPVARLPKWCASWAESATASACRRRPPSYWWIWWARRWACSIRKSPNWPFTSARTCRSKRRTSIVSWAAAGLKTRSRFLMPSQRDAPPRP